MYRSGLSAFVACRLIALDKCPGVRPIGVGEVVRRIVGKAVFAIVKMDILETAGSLQLCTGQDAGCEAVIHAMCSVFGEESTEAVLLVDASSAFNSQNRKLALHNISFLCPALATVFIRQASFLNQARASHRPAHTWFLEITFIPPKCVCVCVYVHPRGHI